MRGLSPTLHDARQLSLCVVCFSLLKHTIFHKSFVVCCSSIVGGRWHTVLLSPHTHGCMSAEFVSAWDSQCKQTPRHRLFAMLCVPRAACKPHASTSCNKAVLLLLKIEKAAW
jgi:hypothetical protein